MSEAADFWYIRLPDGQVLRAATTAIVRQHLEAGRIPAGSMVRRTSDGEWVTLAWTREFADLAAKAPPSNGPAAAERQAARARRKRRGRASSVASRLDPQQLQLVGVRGLMQELVAALDSTLVRKKLLAAGLTGLLLGFLLALYRLPAVRSAPRSAGFDWYLAAAALLLVAATTGLLTRLTYVELARLRPARWREGLTGLDFLTVRLAVTQGLVVGSTLGLIALLRWLPTWLLAGAGAEGGAREVWAAVAVVAGLVLEVCLWPVCVFALLLGPILVVEGSSVLGGLRQWVRLIRQRAGRVLLYEALAMGQGLIATLPFAFPLLALYGLQLDERLLGPAQFTRHVLTGCALAPLLAYLIVANVFIYLNLRYS
ncbi:MAG TPA: hypothetical protein VFE78_32360 [Gemmataceae bacterium]|jgi:hypothetical protein|nr:hypothetical protein [Gemmataceae bacterium]